MLCSTIGNGSRFIVFRIPRTQINSCKGSVARGLILSNEGRAVTAISILFQLFGDARFVDSELSEASYPPVPIRWVQVEMYGLWLIETRWDAGLRAVAMTL